MTVNTRDSVDTRHILEANNLMVAAGKISLAFANTINTRFLDQDEVDPYVTHINGGSPASCDSALGLHLGDDGRFIEWVSYDVFLYRLAKLLHTAAAQRALGHHDHRTHGTYYFIVNTGNSNSRGTHWVSATINIKPQKRQGQRQAARASVVQACHSQQGEPAGADHTARGRGRSSATSSSGASASSSSSSSLLTTALAQFSVFLFLVLSVWAAAQAKILWTQERERFILASAPAPAAVPAVVDVAAAGLAAPAPAPALQSPASQQLQQSGPAEEQLPLEPLSSGPHSPAPPPLSRKRERPDGTPGQGAKRARFDSGQPQSKRVRLFE